MTDIVILTGLADTRWTWRPVEAALAELGTVAIVDRTRHEKLPSLARETDRVAEVVAAHGMERPLVVAHSLGAFIGEAYARRYPVAGLLAVDPSWEPGARPRGAVGRGVVAALFGGVGGAGWLLDVTGAARWFGPLVWRLSLRSMALRHPDAGVSAAARAVYRRGETLVAAAAEELAFRDLAAELVEVRASHPEIAVPVVVLTAVGTSAVSADSRRWIERHRRLTALFPHGRHEIVRGAGHLVHVDRPEVIVRWIDRLANGEKYTGLSTGPVDNRRLWISDCGRSSPRRGATRAKSTTLRRRASNPGCGPTAPAVDPAGRSSRWARCARNPCRGRGTRRPRESVR